ncbi:MAG: MFS transporter [Desulfomonilaceae bacterium]
MNGACSAEVEPKQLESVNETSDLSIREDTMDHRELVFLAVSHMFNDVSQGAVPALLPFLVTQRGLTYVAASGLVLAATVLSSLIQPVLGYYSDRHPIPWLMPFGVLVGGLGLAFAGVAPTYWLLVFCVLLSGLGVAAYHPEGSRFANYVSGQRATGMSYFTVGGTIGFSLGPIMITPLVLRFGLPGTLFMVIPSIIVAAGLVRELPRLSSFRPHAQELKPDTDDNAQWGAFARLTAVIVLRVCLYFSMMTFVPLYFIRVQGSSIPEANSALTLMVLSGALGSGIGGFIADRIGLKSLLLGSLFAIPPLLLGFLVTDGLARLVCLALVGLTTIGSSSTVVLLGQSYLRSRIGVASGVTLGAAIGLGGISVPMMGIIADHYGLTTTLYSMFVFPLLAIVLALTLPGPAGRTTVTT